MNKKKVVIFSGAGISKESGISTFRDSDDGLWLNHSIEEVASLSGMMKNMELVFGFHNTLRQGMDQYSPNEGHITLKEMEKYFDVTIVTQNIDNLHEKAGSSKVYHLHGELMKSRSMLDGTIYDCSGDINVGDMCPIGGQLRPHTVLFEEIPYNVQEAYEALEEADILIIVGTSLSITYTLPLLASTSAKEIYYVDPKPSKNLELSLMGWNKSLPKYIKKSASLGLPALLTKLIKNHVD